MDLALIFTLFLCPFFVERIRLSVAYQAHMAATVLPSIRSLARPPTATKWASSPHPRPFSAIAGKGSAALSGQKWPHAHIGLINSERLFGLRQSRTRFFFLSILFSTWQASWPLTDLLWAYRC